MRVLLTLIICLGVCYGKYAKVGDYPYFAVMEIINQPFCAGVILSENLVLVPYYCLRGVDLSQVILIAVGEVQMRPIMKTYIARHVLLGDDYINDPRYHDVGFVLLTEKLKFNSNVQPLKRIHKYSEKAHQEFTLVGFTTKNLQPDKMETFTEKEMNYMECSNYLSFGESVELTTTNICTVKNQKGKLNRANYGYLLVSKKGELIGLPKYFSKFSQGPNVFIELDLYEDIIDAAIEKYANTN